MKNEHEDYRSELENWTNLWDDMEAQEIHPKPEPPRQSDSDLEDPYFDVMDIEERDNLIQEEEDVPDKVPDHHTKQENPVHPDSGGPDYSTTPPVWLDNKLLDEVEDLRNRLFKLENDLATNMGGGEKWVTQNYSPNDKKMLAEIESLKDKIEKVSSKLGLEKGLLDANRKRQHLGFNG